jgi:hypothetical protein
MGLIYGADMEYVDKVTRSYRVGALSMSNESAEESWRRVEAAVPGLRLFGTYGKDRSAPLVPFVYESPDAEYLKEFRITHRLDEVVKGTRSEYEAMLSLASWVGTRWDHGTDEVPGGRQVCDPSAVVKAGEGGLKFWCEITARTMVHAATALGWPARVVTASRDGYIWDHAVAELWSNEFDKWFVIDTDFNLVFENSGVPQSAFELSRHGERLQAEGSLDARLIASAKPSLPFKDLVPFFAYIHIDMRNDWCSRRLPRGSPAGGDLATWYTARPALGRILTARRRIDDSDRFDWHVNSVAIQALGGTRLDDGRLKLNIGLTGYSPVFESFEVSQDGQGWQLIENESHPFLLSPGVHRIGARLVTSAGHRGPEATVNFDLMPEVVVPESNNMSLLIPNH